MPKYNVLIKFKNWINSLEISSVSNLKTTSFLTFVLVTFQTFSQENFSSLGETALTINTGISEKYDINFTVRSRYFLYQKNKTQYNQQQIDLFHFSQLN